MKSTCAPRLEDRQLKSNYISAQHRSCSFCALYPIYVRGEAYRLNGRGTEAAAEYQKILDHSGIVVNDPIRAVARLQLGRAYALSGDKSKAHSAYQNFVWLWKSADSDIPILKQAKTEIVNFR